jgi:hypothetical protein
MTELEEVAQALLSDYLYWLGDLDSAFERAALFADIQMDDTPQVIDGVAQALHKLAKKRSE